MATFSSCARGMVKQNVICAMYSILSTGAINWGRLYLPLEEDGEDAAAVAEMVAHLNETVKRLASDTLQKKQHSPDMLCLSEFWVDVMAEMREWSEVHVPTGAVRMDARVFLRVLALRTAPQGPLGLRSDCRLLPSNRRRLPCTHRTGFDGRPELFCSLFYSGPPWPSGGVPCAVRALCEKLAVLHHREFGKFRRLKGRH